MTVCAGPMPIHWRSCFGLHTTPAAALWQVGIPVLGVVENMSGLSQQLDKFRFFSPGPDGSQQDVTEQVMQHLPAELQVCRITADSALCEILYQNICCIDKE